MMSAKGVEVRQGKTGATLRIRFSFKGVECRETLKLPPTKANLLYAERLRGEILNAIARGTFDYAKTFPDSKRSAATGVKAAVNETVSERLDAMMARFTVAESLGNFSPSTLKKYESIVRCQLKPVFGAYKVKDLDAVTIREWIEGMGVTWKTAANTISPLRMALSDAVHDGVIESNPVDKLQMRRLLQLTTTKSTWQVEPFTAAEIKSIIAHSGKHAPLFAFAFATGLRTSELMALEWRDIDMKNKLIHITRARVAGKTKGPKTKAGFRLVDLSAEAMAALDGVAGRDGLVFPNPNTGEVYARENTIRKAWAKILKRAGVKYRNPYQTRHTYASQLLSSGANMWWVARQMGHSSLTPIINFYGRWIPDADRVAQLPPARLRAVG
jgi:integrase